MWLLLPSVSPLSVLRDGENANDFMSSHCFIISLIEKTGFTVCHIQSCDSHPPIVLQFKVQNLNLKGWVWHEHNAFEKPPKSTWLYEFTSFKWFDVGHLMWRVNHVYWWMIAIHTTCSVTAVITLLLYAVQNSNSNGCVWHNPRHSPQPPACSLILLWMVLAEPYPIPHAVF